VTRIVTVVGARPQFIKAGPVSRAFRDAGIDETLIHTGQHFDDGMSTYSSANWVSPPPTTTWASAPNGPRGPTSCRASA